MNRNFMIVIQYEGTRYQGWQRQGGSLKANTIQDKIEQILTKMEGKKIEINGSGRTDAGVHALGQTANFHIDTERSKEEILEYLNRYLPEDIGVISIKEMSERFHCRLHAKSKTYCYRVWNRNIPHIFERRYMYEVQTPLDVERMRTAAELLVGTHDFLAFSSAKAKGKSTVRTIYDIRIEEKDGEVRFTFHGNGFLYHMVRILVGTLLEIGTGEREPECIPAIFESRSREQAGALVPAQGLTLVEVDYE